MSSTNGYHPNKIDDQSPIYSGGSDVGEAAPAGTAVNISVEWEDTPAGLDTGKLYFGEADNTSLYTTIDFNGSESGWFNETITLPGEYNLVEWEMEVNDTNGNVNSTGQTIGVGTLDIVDQLNTNRLYYTGCGPDICCNNCTPVNQTDSQGVFTVSNDGDVPGSVEVSLTEPCNDGWTLRLSTTNSTNDSIVLDTTKETITTLDVGAETDLWNFFTCENVTGDVDEPGCSIRIEGGLA